MKNRIDGFWYVRGGEAVQVVVHEYRAMSEDNSCLGVRPKAPGLGVSGEKKQNAHLGSSRQLVLFRSLFKVHRTQVGLGTWKSVSGH